MGERIIHVSFQTLILAGIQVSTRPSHCPRAQSGDWAWNTPQHPTRPLWLYQTNVQNKDNRRQAELSGKK